MGKKTEKPAEPLSRPEFIARARKLRRINMRGWMLLFTLTAFAAVMPVASWEGPNSMYGVLLIIAPLVFMLRIALSGDKFRCPYCKAVFTEETAPLIVATGKCTTCSSVILTPAPPELQHGDKIFSREAFIHYHRFDRSQCKLWFISLILIIIYIALWIFNTYTLVFLRLYPEIRFFVRVFYYYYYFFVIFTFGIFAIAYFLNRMGWRQPRGFNKCPHCHCLLDGVLPEVAIASGRCGLCGNAILDHTTPAAVEGIYLKYRINTLPPEFYWIIHAVMAVIILGVGMAYLEYSWMIYLLIGLGATELLLIAWRLDFFRRLRRRCNHRRSSLITKYTGHCGVCGEDLTSNPILFKPVDGRTVFYFKDKGVNWEAFTIISGLICFSIPMMPFSEWAFDGWPARLIGILILILVPTILFLIHFARKERQKSFALLLDDGILETLGPAGTVIRREDVTDVNSSESLNSEQNCFNRQWSIKTGNQLLIIDTGSFSEQKYLNQALAAWLGQEEKEAPSVISNDAIILKIAPEKASAEITRPYGSGIVALMWCIPLGAGLCILFRAWLGELEILCLFLLIVACLALIVWLYGLMWVSQCHEAKSFLRKYTGIRLDEKGLTLTGEKEKFYPKKKIRKIAISSYADGGQKQYVMHLYTCLTIPTIKVHLEWFADPERARRMLSAWDARR